jgi:hypothetical protein
MTSPDNAELEEIAAALDRHTETLEKKGLTLVVSLLRIAKCALLMRIDGISEDQVDLLSFVLHAVERERAVQLEQSTR